MRILLVCLLVCLCSSVQAQASPIQNAEQDAQQSTGVVAIETFHETLLQVMQVADQSEREAVLQAQIESLFDVSRIASISLGRTWRSLEEGQKSAFVILLKELIVATYADRFDSFSGQQFVTRQVQPVKSGEVVQTNLVRSSGEAVTLDYFMRDGKVFNVVADGVSDLSLRRADYNSIIKKEGYASLLVHIEDKIAVARGER